MRSPVVLTTFPLAATGLYGARFLEQAAEHGIHLTLVHYEDFGGVPSFGETRIDAGRGSIHEDVALWQFRHEAAVMPHTNNYRFQMARFAWKAFAMTREDIVGENQWLVWLDADLIIHGPPDWGELLNGDADVSYLGRSQWDHSETGFLAFNLWRRGGDILRGIRKAYSSMEVAKMQQWHDAWVFDEVCRQLPHITRHNLSPDAVGLDAWEASPLIKWSTHLKGNRKFKCSASSTS